MKKRLFALMMALLFSVSMLGLPLAQAAENTEVKDPTVDVPTVKITVTAKWYQKDGKTAYTGEHPAVSYELYEGMIEEGEKPVKTYSMEAGKDTLEFDLEDDDKTYTLKEVFATESKYFAEAANQVIDLKLGQGLTPLFSHTYVEPIKGTPATVNLSAEVTYDGAAPADGAYSVVLSDKTTGNVVQTKKNVGKNVTFDALTFDNEGTYNYTVSEQVGTSTTINYDATVYDVAVNVAKDANGNYQATTSTQKADAAFTGTIVFANTKKSSTTNTTTKTTTVTVTKVWKSDKESSRPTSISVQLYRNGSVYGSAVRLTEEKNWKYTWSNLDSSYEWTVNETAVPTGYTRSVTHSGNDWTITNTAKTGSSTSSSSTTSTPTTGDERGTSSYMMIAGLFLAAALCFGAAYVLKKKTK